MGAAIRPSALVAMLAAPRIACFGRCLMVAAGPRILVRQRAMMGSAGSAAAAAEAGRERRRATTSRRSGRHGLRDGLRVKFRPRGQSHPRSRFIGDPCAVHPRADMAAAPRNVGAAADSAGHRLPG